MKNNPYLLKQRLNSLYRKLISLWTSEDELTQDMYDNFLVQENANSIDTSGQPVILIAGGGRMSQKQLDQFRRSISRPLDLVEADKNPLWRKYVVETVVVPRIDENGGVLPDPPEPLPPIIIGGGKIPGGGAPIRIG